MSYKTYFRNGVTYRYFTCPHAKEQTGEDGCCKRYVIEDNLNEIVWSVIRQLLDMTDAFKQKLDKQNNVGRQDNLILAEKLAADIAELEQKFKDAETMKDDNLSQALSVMKKYSGADELTQEMVQELIEKVIVTDPEHVETIWKFKDEIRKFIGI